MTSYSKCLRILAQISSLWGLHIHHLYFFVLLLFFLPFFILLLLFSFFFFFIFAFCFFLSQLMKHNSLLLLQVKNQVDHTPKIQTSHKKIRSRETMFPFPSLTIFLSLFGRFLLFQKLNFNSDCSFG